MKLRHILFTVCITILTTPAYGQQWKQISAYLGENTIHHILVNEFNSHHLLASSEYNLHVTYNGGQMWKKLFHSNNEESKIIFILSEPIATNVLYVGTNTAVHLSDNNGTTWQKIYSFGQSEEHSVTSMAINPFNPHELAIGTSTGLFISANRGKSWTKARGQLQNESIVAIAYHPNIKGLLFVTTQRGIYSINRLTDTINRRHSLSYDDDNLNKNVHDTINFFSINDSLILITRGKKLYLSTTLGEKWTDITHNLGYKKDISGIVTSLDSDTVIISLIDTIVTYNIKTANATFFGEGLYSSHIYDLALYQHDEAMLFAATDRGIFTLQLTPPDIEHVTTPIEISVLNVEHALNHFKNEPSISEIQEKAIQYAHVSNTKIKQWHRNARLRGFIPTLSIDLDKSIQDSVDIDRGSTSTEDSYIIGPQEKDFTWGVSLEWELANVLWNDDQTTIDYRDKYTIEMREDILNEVTKLYFERKKLQLELYLAPPHDTQTYLNLCLKIDELTAHIDALTGGYLSTYLNKKDRRT